MRFLRGLGLFIAISCIVWVAVLWHWQVTHRDMSTEDILVYLVALPITVFVLARLGVWAWSGASAKAAAAASTAGGAGAPANSAAGSNANAAGAATDAAARHATVQLLAAHAVTPAGTSIADLVSAAEAGAPRPELHESLRDAQGLPLMAACIKDLVIDETAQALERLAQQPADKPAGHATVQPSETLVRSLALLSTPLIEAVQALAPWSDRLMPPPREPGQQAQPPRHRVRVVPAWPAGTTEPELDLSRRWLASQLRMHGEGIVAPEAWTVHAGTACTGPELWLEVDRLLTSLQREGLDDPVLVLASHSDLSEATVQQLDDAGLLFGASRPKGVIPGEAAAALLLAGPQWPAANEDRPPCPHLHRAALARRDKSVDAPGRVSADLSAELLRQAIVASQLEPKAIAGLADDADQHSPRSAELFGALLAQLPDLDAAEDQRMAGHLLGRTGAAGTLLAVAMAAHCATTSRKPWTALAVGDAHWRLALVARPEAPPTADESANASPAAAGSPTTS